MCANVTKTVFVFVNIPNRQFFGSVNKCGVGRKRGVPNIGNTLVLNSR
jgi:hypothetical protein